MALALIGQPFAEGIGCTASGCCELARMGFTRLPCFPEHGVLAMLTSEHGMHKRCHKEMICLKPSYYLFFIVPSAALLGVA